MSDPTIQQDLVRKEDRCRLGRADIGSPTKRLCVVGCATNYPLFQKRNPHCLRLTTSTIIIIAAAVRINLNQKRDSFSREMGLAADQRERPMLVIGTPKHCYHLNPGQR